MKNRKSELDAWIGKEIEAGRLLAAQYALALDGEIIAGGSFGTATEASRFCIFSATKVLVAATLLPSIGSGALDVTKPVAEYVPEFAANGKGAVTVEQVMLMQGGFPQAPFSPKYWGTSAARREGFARWTLEWEPGTRSVYHPMSAHWVLAELIETLSGRPYLDEIHRVVSEPIGLPPLIGPMAAAHDIVPVRLAGEASSMAEQVATFGSPELVPVATVTTEGLLALNHPEVRHAGVPGGGGFVRASDLALVYQAFLHDRAGAFPPQALEDARSNVRNRLIDEASGVPALRTLVFVIGGDDGRAAYRWRPDGTPRTFGHNGAGGQLAWADPDSGLSFVFLADTLDQDPRVDFLRSRRLNELALSALSERS
jgi:CubicO group peptidase (beta-lactamase class C family)